MSPQAALRMEISSHQARLFQQLNEQRKQEMFCDCSIIVEGRVFKGHRNVLFASCGYFRMLLLHSAQDAGQPTVATFNVFSADAFAIILDFIYSGTLSLSSQNVIDVMSAASYLQMTDVFSVCKNFIKSSLDISIKEKYLNYSNNGKITCGEAISLHTISQNLETNSCRTQKNSNLGCLVGQSRISFNFHQAISSLPFSRDQLSISIANNQEHMDVSELAVYKASTLCVSGANARTSEHKNVVPYSDKKRVPGLESIALPVSFFRHQQIDMLPLLQDFSDSIEQPSQNGDRKTKDCNPSIPKIVEVADKWKREIAGDCNVLRKVRFKCPFCTHTVKRKSDLKRHLRSHTGERPYYCNSCDKRFTRLEHLRNHHLSVHRSRDIITCKVCKKPFTGIATKTAQDGATSLGLCINCIDATNSDEPIDLDSHTDHNTEFQESEKESGWISREPDGETEFLSSGGDDPESCQVHAAREILADEDEQV